MNYIESKKVNLIAIGILIVSILSVWVLSIKSPVYADYDVIYEDITVNQISQGAVHEEYSKFTDSGWININVIRVDLDNKYTGMKLLTNSEYLNLGGTVEELVDGDESVIGGINGDFFNTNTHEVMGQMIDDGDILSSSKGIQEFASFMQNEEESWIGYVNNIINYVMNIDNNLRMNIEAINKINPQNYSSIYLDNRGSEKSIGKVDGMEIVEVVVKNGQVLEIRENQEAQLIGDDEYILVFTNTSKEVMSNYYRIGDNLELELDSDIENLDLIMGGGAQIVLNGEIMESYSHLISGNHPRTAIGIVEDENEIILVTVDGRSTSYPGVSMDELAQIMIDLGASSAMNLDGGGSTTMAINQFGRDYSSISNFPSDGYQRTVYNGIGLVDLSPKTELDKLQIIVEDEELIQGIGVEIEVLGADSNLNPYEINAEDLVYAVEGVEGDFVNGVFTPTTSGYGKLIVNYEGLEESVDIEVTNDPVRLIVTPSEINLESGMSTEISAEIKTKNGTILDIDLEQVSFEIPDGIGSLSEDGIFTSQLESGQGILKFQYQGLTSYIPVTIGGESFIIHDFENQIGDFISYPEEVKGGYELIGEPYTKEKSGMLYYDFSSTTATRAAYISFEEAIEIPSNAQKIGMQVYGDNSGSWLRGKVTDAQGTTANIDFTMDIDFEGWNYVEASLPETLVGPIVLDRIYVVETDPDVKTVGLILIDDLLTFMPNDFAGEIPEDIHNEIKLEDMLIKQEGKNYEYKNGKLYSADQAITEENFDFLSSDFLYLELDNDSGSIRIDDYSQWKEILEWKNNYSDENIIINLNFGYWFIDELEEILFLETLNELKEQNDNLIVISETVYDSSYFTEDGIDIYKINEKDTLNISIKEDIIEVENIVE